MITFAKQKRKKETLSINGYVICITIWSLLQQHKKKKVQYKIYIYGKFCFYLYFYYIVV